jgi:drug/metabolite transporter (DMT)-like permease
MLTDWVTVAILSAAAIGIVNIFDSHLISRRVPSFRAFLLPVGMAHLAYGLVLFFLFPLPGDLEIWPVLVAVASGMFRVTGLGIMLYTMKSEEVSRVIPVVYIYPIFVAIMAVPLLGESLHYLQWLAILVVVAGAVMISFRKGSDGATTLLSKPIIRLISAAVFLAIADITSKYALDYISFWNMFSISVFCLSGTFLLISVRPHVIRDLKNMKKRNPVLVLFAINETLAPAGIVLSFWAMERGPISLVSTILSSRPIFVVIYALILSRLSPMFLEWQPGRAMLVLRLVATAMIVGGIAIIYLT